MLLRSRAAKALAVRQITQLNKGKKTAGVDGKTALTTKERLVLCQKLHPYVAGLATPEAQTDRNSQSQW
ncbi:MAG: reverse transcriptase N-terminal domain-containing protein [Prochloron sp. SP5CPC1]|nr:reverse transcriptase N-terminal domain-containing protein [Candidatus Paraprochloron terpiosi SP5CPC1]